MKYIIGVIGVVLALIVLIIILVSGSNGSKPNSQATSTKLTDYNTSSSQVTLTTEGPIVGDEDYREIRITVSQSKRVIQILKGYNENVVSSKTYSNNSRAYQVFLSALDQLGFRAERKSSISDPSGTCPTGQRFIYQLTDNNQDVENTWDNSCNLHGGTFGGNATSVQDLFQAQIHNYDDLTSSVQI